MTPEERAKKIAPCWQPDVDGCCCPMCLVRPHIAAHIREAVAEDRNLRTAEDLYKHSYNKGLEDAAKIVSLDCPHGLCRNCKPIIDEIRAKKAEPSNE